MGRWRPSKFFIFEICVLYDLFIWFTQTAPIFAWADACDFFNPLVLNCLYCHTDLLELNHLFCIYILRPEDIKGEVSFFTNFKTLGTDGMPQTTNGQNFRRTEIWLFRPAGVAFFDCQKLRNDPAGVGVISWGTEWNECSGLPRPKCESGESAGQFSVPTARKLVLNSPKKLTLNG